MTAGRVYGVRLRGDVPASFGAYLLPDAPDSGRSLDLVLRIAGGDPGSLRAIGETVWRSPDDVPEAAGTVTVTGVHDSLDATTFGLRVDGPEPVAFGCAEDGITIHGASTGPRLAHRFFTLVLPLWLETRGVPVLHGSAVTLPGDGRAVGFLAPSGTGKSVLSTELARRGCGFLSDDGLALFHEPDGWVLPPGPPLARLWPSGLESRSEVEAEGLERVIPESDKRRLPVAPNPAPEPHPLAALFVLDRRPEIGGPVNVTPLSRRQALEHFLAHGVAAAPATALGLAEKRLDRLVALATDVPMYGLSVPSGRNGIERVLTAVVSTLGPASRPAE